MQRSLSTRLVSRIMAVVLVMITIIASVVYYAVKEYMLDEARERYLGVLLENHQEMRRWLADIHVAIENNVHDIERDIDNPDIMFDHMERIVKQNGAISCCAMLFEQYYYPNKGRVFIPCARRDASDSVRVTRIDTTYHSKFYDDWFPELIKKDQSAWSKPYLESSSFAGDQEPRILTTYAVPIHNHDGRPVAVIAADMSLEWLSHKLTKDMKEINDQYEEGQEHQSFFFIVDRDGTYVMHPNKKLMLTHFDVGNTMAKHRGTCVTEIDGVKSRLYYRTYNKVGWTMVIVVPEDAILSQGRSLNIIIILTMIIGLLAIYLFCRRQIKEIADPFAAQKAALERELTIAHNIQMALLPKSFPEHYNIELYAKQTPARDVGGDLYDYFLRDHYFIFCIGDVSGKGVPAALLMAVMKSMFRSVARSADNAADIVEAMNHNLGEEYTGGDFVTMFVGILDLTTGHLDFCNAGHEVPLISGKPLNVVRNLPVGALPLWDYEGQQTQLKPGDILFLYTDGLSEAKNSADELLGRKIVQKLASEHCSDTAQQLVELMEEEIHRHAADTEQSDDITLLAFRWQPDNVTMSAR